MIREVGIQNNTNQHSFLIIECFIFEALLSGKCLLVNDVQK